MGRLAAVLLLVIVIVAVVLAGPYPGDIRYSQGPFNVAPNVMPGPDDLVADEGAERPEVSVWPDYIAVAERWLPSFVGSIALFTLVVLCITWYLGPTRGVPERMQEKKYRPVWYLMAAMAIVGIGVPSILGLAWLFALCWGR